MRRPEVKRTTGLSGAQIYRLMAVKKFPQSVPLGLKARGWDSTAIYNWIEERIASASAANTAARSERFRALRQKRAANVE
jgi:prophage regulatory protein